MGGAWRVWAVWVMVGVVGGTLSAHVHFQDEEQQQEDQDTTSLKHGTSENVRDKRVFIMLAEVRPDQCTTSNSTSSLGTCLTARDCTQRGGSSSGTCANGFGVCCLITRTCNSATSLNNTYFRQPTSSSDLGACTVSINRVNTNICQVRLDFLDLELSQPDDDGNCLDDFLTITGGVSPVPMICGLNTGQHIYYDLDPKGGTLKLTVDRATVASLSRNWNIKVTQIPCDSKYRAPVGCLQYFTETTSTINSFNFANTNQYVPGTRQLANLDYGVCIKRADNYCGITWEANAINGRFAFTVSGAADATDINLIGTSYTSSTNDACTDDYVVMPGGIYRTEANNNMAKMADRYCGLGFPNIVSSTAQPFMLFVKTNENETVDQGNRGFSLTYRQTTTCT